MAATRPAVDPIGMGGFVDAVTQAKIARAHDVAHTLVKRANEMASPERGGRATVVPENVRDELFLSVFEAPGETSARINKKEAQGLVDAMNSDGQVTKAERALVDVLLQRNRCDSFGLTDGARTLLKEFAGSNRVLG